MHGYVTIKRSFLHGRVHLDARPLFHCCRRIQGFVLLIAVIQSACRTLCVISNMTKEHSFLVSIAMKIMPSDSSTILGKRLANNRWTQTTVNGNQSWLQHFVLMKRINLFIYSTANKSAADETKNGNDNESQLDELPLLYVIALVTKGIKWNYIMRIILSKLEHAFFADRKCVTESTMASRFFFVFLFK